MLVGGVEQAGVVEAEIVVDGADTVIGVVLGLFRREGRGNVATAFRVDFGAAALAEAACCRRVAGARARDVIAALRPGVAATAASRLTQSGDKSPHSKVGSWRR